MIILLEESRVPPYVQVRQQIEEQVRSAVLPHGTRLPSIRQLATQLNLAANTVARAYRELERSGLVVTHGRNGTLVSDVGSHGAKQAELFRAGQEYLEAAARLGLNPREACEGVQTAMDIRLAVERDSLSREQVDDVGVDAPLVTALRAAVGVRATFEQARGVVAEQLGTDMDSAMRAMRASADQRHLPLAAVTRHVVDQRGL